VKEMLIFQLNNQTLRLEFTQQYTKLKQLHNSLVCRLGGAGVGAGNLALKAPVLQAEALIPCVVTVNKKIDINHFNCTNKLITRTYKIY
jgi:hypothetical protein